MPKDDSAYLIFQNIKLIRNGPDPKTSAESTKKKAK